MVVEYWKDITGYEGIYQVSNTGRVKSLARYDSRGRLRKESMRKLSDNGLGYLFVELSLDGASKKYYVHRLVATAFIEKDASKGEVNHKDEDKYNNSVENLEWVNRLENVNYGSRSYRSGITQINCTTKSKPVKAKNIKGNISLVFPSIAEASRNTGLLKTNICKCLKGKQKTCGGMYWEYYTDYHSTDFQIRLIQTEVTE